MRLCRQTPPLPKRPEDPTKSRSTAVFFPPCFLVYLQTSLHSVPRFAIFSLVPTLRSLRRAKPVLLDRDVMTERNVKSLSAVF